jgi:hypothetical protein
MVGEKFNMGLWKADSICLFRYSSLRLRLLVCVYESLAVHWVPDTDREKKLQVSSDLS